MAAGDVYLVDLIGNSSNYFCVQANSIFADRRTTETGDVRHTEAGNTRIAGYGTTVPPGRIYVSGPAFTLFYNHAGDWRLADPRVRHNGVWKTPRRIHIKDGGVWRAVQTPEPQE